MNEYIKTADGSDVEILAKLANALWTKHALQNLITEYSKLLERDDICFFIKYIGNEPIGFAQCQLRYDYVEGTNTSPVGYLEGVYIQPEYRRGGYARQLLSECEIWSKKKGCTEFASDCQLENEQSLNFHLKSGFQEVNRIICFTKVIR
ncbi:MAG: aminoglycoside 6'-N-acetyltransferase [Christensenellaceae bacterium]